MQVKAIETMHGFARGKARKAAAPGFWNQIVGMFTGTRDGIRLAGQYKELTNLGVPPREAVRHVFEK